MTKNYLLFIVNRALSGIVNGLYYVHSVWLWPTLFVLALFTFFELYNNLIDKLGEMKDWNIGFSIFGLVGSVVCCIMLGVSFIYPKFYFSDIHLWTFLHQTGLAGTLFFSNKKPLNSIWWLALAVSPSAFLQKIFINIIPGYSWDYEGTDDPTGHFWSMTVFGVKIMIPRLADMKIKLVISVICIISFFIVKHLLKNRKSQFS